MYPMTSHTTENTLERITPIAKQIGITRIANITGLDHIGIPVANCIRPNAKHLSVSQGKGVNWELAKISAIMESIEAYHAENPQEADLFGTFNDLQLQHNIIHPRYFANQFFDCSLESVNLPWIWSTHLISNQSILIPHDVICLDSSKPLQHRWLFNVTSNGLAAGNTKEEAMLHALYEIIERNTLTNWKKLSSAEKTHSQIDLTSITSEINQALLNKFSLANIQVTIWDITSHLPIPAYYCMITDDHSYRNLGVFFGSGAHHSADIALMKALLEAAQSRLTFIAGTRDEIFPHYYAGKKNNSNSFILVNGNKKFISNNNWLMTVDELINDLIHHLMQNHFQQIILLDHTKKELNIPVVHIFIPGMS
ncbi:MAG: hypothetical protein ACD_46C00194G0001 [uncultured bacterium]|nr:MAG: hypothetical protein ACD_46C00194G0001 [uncultured bacterium]